MHLPVGRIRLASYVFGEEAARRGREMWEKQEEGTKLSPRQAGPEDLHALFRVAMVVW